MAKQGIKLEVGISWIWENYIRQRGLDRQGLDQAGGGWRLGNWFCVSGLVPEPVHFIPEKSVRDQLFRIGDFSTHGTFASFTLNDSIPATFVTGRTWKKKQIIIIDKALLYLHNTAS